MNIALHDARGKFKKGHPYCGPGKGYKQSEETKAKISKIRKGKTWEEIFGEEKAIQMKDGLSKGRKNTKFTLQHRENLWKLKRKERVKHSAGYWLRRVYDNHPRISKKSPLYGGYVYEHILIAEKALGRYLVRGEVVHHVNGNKSDNKNTNLLICENAYHSWLHGKMARLYMQKSFGDIQERKG